MLFIAKMLDNVPSSFLVKRSTVLFFRTMLKSLSKSALLCGIEKTNTASFDNELKRFTSVPGITSFEICGALRDLVPFVQFKKREKHPWRSVTFSKVAGSKSSTPPWLFFTFLKLYKWYQMAQNITFATIKYEYELSSSSKSFLSHKIPWPTSKLHW